MFHDNLILALVADDVLYLKADDESPGLFEQEQLWQFQYQKGPKVVKMSYYMAPEEIFDDPDKARLWAVRAFEAALRAKKPVAKGKDTT